MAEKLTSKRVKEKTRKTKVLWNCGYDRKEQASEHEFGFYWAKIQLFDYPVFVICSLAYKATDKTTGELKAIAEVWGVNVLGFFVACSIIKQMAEKLTLAGIK